VEIPDGVHLEAPIVLRWPSAAPGRALVTRTIVTLGAGASASLVEEQVACGPSIECAEGENVPQGFFHGTTEVVLGPGASLAMASIQDFGPGQIAFQHRHATIGEGASLHWALAQLGGRLVRSRVDNLLEGDRSSVEQVEIVFGGEQQLFDLTSYTRHIGRDTTGNLLSKGALLDRSRSFMKGMITIERSAVGTDSFLGEFGMNLSKAARAVAIPSLEIDQPDCRRAAHSSSVGPIDPNQLFYLESRGISPDEARKFIVLGFLEPVVARVPLESARDRLRDLLEEKWSAGLAASGAAASTAA
jgi:Fe-S cluster assembly scaffold protein SufB